MRTRGITMFSFAMLETIGILLYTFYVLWKFHGLAKGDFFFDPGKVVINQTKLIERNWDPTVPVPRLCFYIILCTMRVFINWIELVVIFICLHFVPKNTRTMRRREWRRCCGSSDFYQQMAGASWIFENSSTKPEIPPNPALTRARLT